MTETKSPGDKTLSVSKTLTLKRPSESGVVRQSFSHGRSKAVVVEKVKRRTGPGEAGGQSGSAPAPAKPASVTTPLSTKPRVGGPPASPSAGTRPSGVVLRTLTDDERDARTQALQEARVREADERRAAVEEARRRIEREAKERVEREAAEARKREEEARRALEDEARRKAEQEARKRFGEEEAARRAAGAPAQASSASQSPSSRPPYRSGGPGSGPRPAGAGPRPAGAGGPRSSGPGGGAPRPGGAGAPAMARPGGAAAPGRPGAPGGEEEEARRARRPSGGGPAKPVIPPKAPKATPGEEKRRGRLTVVTAYQEGEQRERSVAAFRRRVQRMTGQRQSETKEKISREVTIPETITIQDLANRMSERAVDVIRMLMRQGQMMKINDVIDADTAQLIAEELGHTVKRVAEADVEEGLFDTPDDPEALQPRPPVVTIMGHVDHGKTSLLDAIRHTHVVAGEAGGITQHIGAYQVTAPSGGRVTFIDTPGHAAFTAMRARGAKVTDVVVLVVAADDGVMPQTIEAINHAKAAKVPLIVAINKIDKPDAKPERVRTELLQHSIVVESMGGDTLEVEVSAKQKLNLDKLLEAVALQAEVLDLKSNPARPAEGTVIEGKLDRGRGPVATVLVQRGTLKVGDIVVAGAEWGRVRALVADTGVQVDTAGPSLPVEVLGFNGTPEAGDRLAVVENEARAREVADYRSRQRRDKAAAKITGRGSLAEMMKELKAGAGRKEFTLLVKADVQGSLEAIVGSLDKLGTDEVMARVVHSGVGGISESDVTLAAASGAAIIGFNVRAHKEAREAAERSGIEIRYYNIIYDLVDDVKQAMSGLLPPTVREIMLGNALVLEVFNITKVGKIAGCRVTDGTVERGAHVRLIRDNVVIHEGKLSQLKRFKDDAKEVLAGQECGMSFENYQDMRAGDVIECYRVETVKRSL
ncbi:translation initiation factor IF-2 [Blastochloris viridis]|uniref:Translation initiation factor IF-2 n=1 Tax=Blastochloris viridis TaxID=1079 RepID=A0A0H5BFN3_BLAVI|nr:translation initiation factor IF-2 [Blastochloris viridis]ALK10849.1 Translation initiation factor IF-2 [Blastochloris viridis]BAR99176.1 translation initiation factor 2 [Blastochloris viridis]CUU43511.1 Translation initiation factor IF-2 [Blastochloris viridis]